MKRTQTLNIVHAGQMLIVEDYTVMMLNEELDEAGFHVLAETE